LRPGPRRGPGLLLPACALALFCLAGCSSSGRTLPGYLARQGCHLLRDAAGGRSVESLLASGSLDAGTRAFLERAARIRRFSVERLGLRANANYTRYKNLGRDHLVDVVSAAGALSFDPYLWRYPLVGALPYRGYYERADAEAEASRLKALGWDTVVRPVDAFSTLGLSRDPLYSFMASYSAFELAATMIHEQTHATIFVRGQPQFNEELASFVGEEGALAWLRETAGEGSAEYRQAVDGLADSEVFLASLQDLVDRLGAVYTADLPRGEKLARKAELIGDFAAGFDTRVRPSFRTASYRDMRLPQLTNAVLSLYGLYGDDVPLIREYTRAACGGDLRALIAACRTLARRGEVKEQMRRALAR
jgi:predicted aminopeptidase